jgi:hypothetical protein
MVIIKLAGQRGVKTIEKMKRMDARVCKFAMGKLIASTWRQIGRYESVDNLEHDFL